MSKLEKIILDILRKDTRSWGFEHTFEWLAEQIKEAISKHMAECPRLTDVEQITLVDTGSEKDMVIAGAIAQYKLCEEHLLKEGE